MIFLLPVVIIAAAVVLLASSGALGSSNSLSGQSRSQPKIKLGQKIGGVEVRHVANALSRTLLTKNKFYHTIVRDGKAYDWSILIPLTMAALETNFSKSCYYYNLFNITTKVMDPDQFFMYPSIPDLKFKMYSGYQESIDHFWRVFNLPLYSKAYQNRHNPEKAISELIINGYAGSMRDPTRYLNMLRSVRSDYNRLYT